MKDCIPYKPMTEAEKARVGEILLAAVRRKLEKELKSRESVAKKDVEDLEKNPK